MEKKICALELATYLVRLGWNVYVSCSSYVDLSIHLDVHQIPQLQKALISVFDVYDFTFDFIDRSDLEIGYFVCRCKFE